MGNVTHVRDVNNNESFNIQPNMGLGLKFKGFSIDYALTNIGSASDVLYSNIFSLKFDLSDFKGWGMFFSNRWKEPKILDFLKALFAWQNHALAGLHAIFNFVERNFALQGISTAKSPGAMTLFHGAAETKWGISKTVKLLRNRRRSHGRTYSLWRLGKPWN